MVMKPSFRILFLAAISLAACTTVQHISKTKVTYEVMGNQTAAQEDPEISQMISPYKVQLDEEMNEVIAHLSEGMTKKKPESTLGNWYTDAMMKAAITDGYNADFAISNYGGLRVPEITAGPLTKGEIYELCPFDNLMVIMDVPGNIVDTIFQQIAATEGWPVSSEVKMVIKDKKMIQCSIHGVPLDMATTYKVVMPDYVANGGDGLKSLVSLTRVQTGRLVRDILIEDAIATAKAGKEITAKIEGRVVVQH